MNKENELKRRCINYSGLVNQQTPRYWVVYQIKYDFENGGWFSVKDLSKTNELKKYGTYIGAEKYALNLYHKYKKELGEDLEVCIKEELADPISELKKVKEEIHKLYETHGGTLACVKACNFIDQQIKRIKGERS